MSVEIHPFPDLAGAVRALAEQVSEWARSALQERGRFSLALSGGSTPAPLFRSLASEYRDSARWDSVEYFWADERAVGPSDPLSNFALAERAWLGPAGIPPARIHRIVGEAPSLEGEAARYQAELGRTLGAAPAGTSGPLLDLALLGIGKDGHTASLFPGSALLEEREAWVAVEPHPGQPPDLPRITLTLPALNRSRRAAFLVAGEDKRAALSRILHPPSGPPALPAGRVQGLTETHWFVDRAALGDSAAS